MLSQPAEEYPEAQSFLRSGSDRAVENDQGGAPVSTNAQGKHQSLIPSPPPVKKEILTQLKSWDGFVALAIGIDRTDNDNSAMRDTLGKYLEAMSNDHTGLWFQWHRDLFACVFPGMAIRDITAQARTLQADLSANRVETVSIGIAYFPLLSFSIEQTLVNACKALDHASFFGPASIVTFDAVSLNISGDSFYQNGRLDDAVNEYRTALQMDPDNVNVLNSLGVCLAEQDNATEAMALFEKASKIDPSESMALYNLGATHMISGDTEKALELYYQAYQLDGATFEIPFQIGKLLTKKQQYDSARSHLEAAIKLRDDYSPAFSLLGRCMACLGQSKAAMAAYTKAVKINPNDAPALSALGALYDARGENPEISIAFCRQSVTLAPDNGLFHLRLARLFHKHNQLAQALTEYERASELGCDAGRQIEKISEMLVSDEKGQSCCAG